MVCNKIQFGVVREDPQTEIELISKYNIKRVLIIGSAGCSALSIKTVFPEVEVSIIEPNLAQIKLIKKKTRIINNNKLSEARKIIGTNINNPLIESGNLESLFKLLRAFICEFVAPRSDFLCLFKSNPTKIRENIFKSPYWKTAFDLYFSDPLLKTMFGPEAIQYADKGSYPDYFRNLLENGLIRSDANTNYFLHHIFLGHYLSNKQCLPDYLQKSTHKLKFKYHMCMADEFQSYSNFGLISLSNIFDWSSLRQIKKISHKVSSTMRPTSILLYRQLNNINELKNEFKNYQWLTNLEKIYHKNDRSLFYSKLCIGRKL